GTRIEILRPIQQIALCKLITARLNPVAESGADGDKALPSELRADFQKLKVAAEDDPSLVLDEKRSAQIAKTFLLSMADDPYFAPLVESELEAFRDEKQFVAETIAVSVAVSIIVIAATTEFTYKSKDGTTTISKKATSPEFVGSLARIVKDIF